MADGQTRRIWMFRKDSRPLFISGSTHPKGETRIRLVWPTSGRAWLYIPLGFSATVYRVFSLSMRGVGPRQILFG